MHITVRTSVSARETLLLLAAGHARAARLLQKLLHFHYRQGIDFVLQLTTGLSFELGPEK